jgi:hypothetical protein
MTNPFSKLAELQARARAIRSSVVVPTPNGVSSSSLDLALARCAAAEKNLEEARLAARTAARAAGRKAAGLFSDSQFVSRATAERWCDEARAEEFENGKAFAREEITRIMIESRGLNYENEMKKIRAEGKAHSAQLDADAARWRKEAPEFFAACDCGNWKLAGQIYFQKYSERDKSGNAARAILTAAARRDSDGANERPEPTGLAAQIVQAGRKRRGEI